MSSRKIKHERFFYSEFRNFIFLYLKGIKTDYGLKSLQAVVLL